MLLAEIAHEITHSAVHRATPIVPSVDSVIPEEKKNRKPQNNIQIIPKCTDGIVTNGYG